MPTLFLTGGLAMSKTIAAVATGNTTAGISVIRISGDNALDIAQKVFSAFDGTPLSSLKGYTAKYGRVLCNGEEFDNAVALVFRAPKSYTGEDVVEISVHGGIFIVEKALQAIFSAGASPAEAGEFTKRAFLNGKLDLAQAESVAQMISAQGQEALRASYNILQGSLSNKISGVLSSLVDCSATMAAWVDYPDEEIPELSRDKLIKTLEDSRASLLKLLENYENGIVMTEGIDTAIVGKPNAGKSTLMNMLSGQEKSIVTHIEGTTRDIVEGTVRLGGLVLHLSDTAGIRQSDDLVEAIGIKKAEDRLKSASLVLAVFDGASPISADDEMIIEQCTGKCCIALINKSDLDCVIDKKRIDDAFDCVLEISAKNGDGAHELEKAIKELLGIGQFDSSQPMLLNQRQKQCVQNAVSQLTQALGDALLGITYDAINVMVDSTVDELLTLTGKKASEEVVNNIFSRFCVGK